MEARHCHIGCCLLLLFGVGLGKTEAQQANRSFAFVDHPGIAGQAGLGGVNLTLDKDPLMFLANPALLDSAHRNFLSVHYQNFPGGIQVGTIGYQWEGPDNWEIGVGLQYLNYGEFEGFDDTGFPLGSFHANEFALSGGISRQSGVFYYGLNLKLLGSVLESYQAYAAVADLGIMYKHPEEDFRLTVVAKQVGVVLGTYLQGQPLSLPTDLRIGISYKAENMPLRFHASVRNLIQETDYYLADPNWREEQESFGEQLFRRLVIGTEIIAHEHVQLRIGYNHLVRREFASIGGQGLGGFTGGFNIQAGKFALAYSRLFYHVAGATHLFGVSTNLNQWRKF